MFLKSLFSIALFSLFALNSLHAKIWTVAPRPGANFTTLSGAVGSASVLAGDTILVSGSPQTYAGFTVNKKLTIIGPGYFLGENANVQADTNSAKISSAVTVSASGTVIMGLYFTSLVSLNADNISVTRCRFESASNYVDLININDQDSVVIQQCYLRLTSTFAYRGIFITSGSTQIFIRNNYLENLSSGYGAISCQGTGAITGDFSNNTIYGDLDNVGGGFTFNNNILRSGTFDSSGVVFNNNIGNSTQFGASNENKQNISMSSVFVSSGTSDSKWQAVDAGPADNAGLDGTDCGMFGGASPYVLSGAPPIPLVYDISGSIDGTLLYMNVKVKSNN